MTAPRLLTVRNPEDVLALAPYVLGFMPEDSLVLMTTGGDKGDPFHARIDLPDDLGDLDLVVEPLVDAARRNGARKAIVVVYTPDADLARETCAQLRDTLGEVGVATALALRAYDGRWFDLDMQDSPGTPYDVTVHPLTAQGVMEGRVTYRTRQELRDSLVTTDPEAVEAVVRACDQAVIRLAGAARHPLGPLTPGRLRSVLVEEGRWARDRVRTALRDDALLADDELARLLAALTVTEVRDVLWADIGRPGARRHVAVWTDMVRRAPLGYAAAPAALLAFAAWMAGDGALAWCALDRCHESDPGYSMAALVGSALQAAMPPSKWKPIDPESLILFSS